MLSIVKIPCKPIFYADMGWARMHWALSEITSASLFLPRMARISRKNHGKFARIREIRGQEFYFRRSLIISRSRKPRVLALSSANLAVHLLWRAAPGETAYGAFVKY